MENIVSVTNRNNGFTGYTIPDLNITRTFNIGETKKISLDELKQLQFVEGGDYLLKHCLIINDKNALEVLNMSDVEPEYFYTEAEIKELLTNGSLDQLEDALNFAPEGVIEIIKSMAIKMELPDIRKRKIISDKTGLNIDNAIMVNEIMKEEHSDVTEKAETKVRKAAPINAGSAAIPTRKAEPVSRYKVVSK